MFLRQDRLRYLTALDKAGRWMESIEADPVALRKRGLKGKKKMVELLDGLQRLWTVAAPGPGKRRIMRRIRHVVAITYEDVYHDMSSLDDKAFKQDATSYMRAAVLMDGLGLDTTRYRAEIKAVKPRLDAHMPTRGPHQRAAFHWYYRHFGLDEPFPLADALTRGLIARRADPARYKESEAYDLTHEIFVPYQFGDLLDIEPFSLEEREWLRGALEQLTFRYIARKNADLVAELVSCLRYLRFVDSAAYREGLLYLLESQHEDGSFGDRGRAARNFGDLANVGSILHTTTVVIDALSVAFFRPWNRSLYPGCRL